LLSVFDEFRTAVNFDEPWSAETLEAYEKAIPYDSGHSKHSGRMTAYPLPLPPDEYEPTYRPKYLVVHAIDGIVFALVTEIDDSIDQGVLNIILLSILLGLIALVTVLVIAWGVSRVLTQPLLWIREVARSIVNNNAEDGQLPLAEEDETSSATVRCAPRTEINQVSSSRRCAHKLADWNTQRILTFNFQTCLLTIHSFSIFDFFSWFQSFAVWLLDLVGKAARVLRNRLHCKSKTN
jgi:hypothetical protein